MAAKIVEMHLSGYVANKKPGYLKLGKKVDSLIEENFLMEGMFFALSALTTTRTYLWTN